MANRKGARVWVRVGDNDEYQDFDNPHEAGAHVGLYTNDRDPVFRNKGVLLGGFAGDNYISLFWGDRDADPIDSANLNKVEQRQFTSGLHEADDEREASSFLPVQRQVKAARPVRRKKTANPRLSR